MMEKLGAPQTHLGLKNMIKEVDEDFDGKLSFREVRNRFYGRTQQQRLNTVWSTWTRLYHTVADLSAAHDVNIGALLDWDLVTGEATGAES